MGGRGLMPAPLLVSPDGSIPTLFSTLPIAVVARLAVLASGGAVAVLDLDGCGELRIVLSTLSSIAPGGPGADRAGELAWLALPEPLGGWAGVAGARLVGPRTCRTRPDSGVRVRGPTLSMAGPNTRV